MRVRLRGWASRSATPAQRAPGRAREGGREGGGDWRTTGPLAAGGQACSRLPSRPVRTAMGGENPRSAERAERRATPADAAGGWTCGVEGSKVEEDAMSCGIGLVGELGPVPCQPSCACTVAQPLQVGREGSTRTLTLSTRQGEGGVDPPSGLCDRRRHLYREEQGPARPATTTMTTTTTRSRRPASACPWCRSMRCVGFTAGAVGEYTHRWGWLTSPWWWWLRQDRVAAVAWPHPHGHRFTALRVAS